MMKDEEEEEEEDYSKLLRGREEPEREGNGARMTGVKIGMRTNLEGQDGRNYGGKLIRRKLGIKRGNCEEIQSLLRKHK